MKRAYLFFYKWRSTKCCMKKWRHSAGVEIVTPRDINKRMTIAQSEFQFIYQSRPLSLPLSSPLFSCRRAHLRRITPGNGREHTTREVRVAQERPFARIIKRDHHPSGVSWVPSVPPGLERLLINTLLKSQKEKWIV